ncbi:MAG: VPLPA-CTERM sorting domain-containing protein [Gammaproteobacteria bacterium]|nr:VPLPA-CTERM sorting domain-containing protein [Gammaproteobacteria bacterium]
MKFRPATALLLALLTGGNALAASLSLVTPASTVLPNSLFTVTLQMDAQDAPGDHPGQFGGAVVISFDGTLLSYQNDFSLAPGLSYFSAPATGSNGNLQTLTFGFDNGADLGPVGTLSFRAIGGIGSVAAIGLADANDFFGTFVSYLPTYKPFYPAFNPTQVQVVPLPAAGWLLASGLAVLGLKRRRRTG